MTARVEHASVAATLVARGCLMPRPAALVLLTLGVFAASANAQAPAPGEAAKEMVGAWEISNAAMAAKKQAPPHIGRPPQHEPSMRPA